MTSPAGPERRCASSLAGGAGRTTAGGPGAAAGEGKAQQPPINHLAARVRRPPVATPPTLTLASWVRIPTRRSVRRGRSEGTLVGTRPFRCVGQPEQLRLCGTEFLVRQPSLGTHLRQPLKLGQRGGRGRLLFNDELALKNSPLTDRLASRPTGVRSGAFLVRTEVDGTQGAQRRHLSEQPHVSSPRAQLRLQCGPPKSSLQGRPA